MDQHDWLTERFEVKRTRMRAVAYRMLGSLSEADDAVQEAWLHLSRADTSAVANLRGYLTTVVARICLGMLRDAVRGPDTLSRRRFSATPRDARPDPGCESPGTPENHHFETVVPACFRHSRRRDSFGQTVNEAHAAQHPEAPVVGPRGGAGLRAQSLGVYRELS